jgi:hypothetical protein
MNTFRISAVSLALGLALALPALAADGTTPDPQGAVKTGPSAQTQAPAEQPRLPADKEATPSITTPSVSGMSADTSKPSAKKGAVKSDLAKGQVDPKKAKHPPTDAMDRATPDEKSTTSEMAESGKNNPTTAMDRATPDQKSP